MTLVINSIAHLLTDAVCASALCGAVAASGDFDSAVLVYNTLAFSTQCAVGLAFDRLKRHETLSAAGLALCAAGLLLPLPPAVRVAAVGLGNSVFHVAAGTVTLKGSRGRAGPLGVFVAPGALGLTVGTLWPQAGTYLAIAALVCCCVMLLAIRESSWKRPDPRPVPWLAVICLLLAVAVRAVGGTAVAFPWKTGWALALAATAFVSAGKAAGGYVMDRLGVRKSAMLSLPLSAALIAFCFSWMLPSLAGQFLLNLTMPVTLWLIYRAMPDSPGFAFGLAASALWPGTILGGFISLTGAALSFLVVLCFVSGLAAIIYACRKIEGVSP